VNLDAIRAAFPALARHHGGHPVAYFDGPGGTQAPRQVADAMVDYLYNHNANTHWAYPSSIETDAALADAREAFADYLGATAGEIVFGANMTTLTFHLARALGAGWGSGDEVVITELDHHANQAPWRRLAQERGITIRVVPLDLATGELDWTGFDRFLSPRTRLVAIGAASNALGTVNDVRRAVVMAHQVGALCFVDAVHYAAHGRVDVRSWGCDFLACSAYKFYGPHVGILYGRHDLLAGLDVPKLAPASDQPPERLETGTLNHEGIVGARAAVDFIAATASGETRRRRLDHALDTLHHRGQELIELLWHGLASMSHVRLLGPPPSRPRTPTLSLTVAGMPAVEVARRLAEVGLFVSSGDFYATTVVERLGLAGEGLVRVGCACYTSDAEVDRLIGALADLGRPAR
jgi:cysteine desulfurase family protein (TIGR01976 family)